MSICSGSVMRWSGENSKIHYWNLSLQFFLFNKMNRTFIFLVHYEFSSSHFCYALILQIPDIGVALELFFARAIYIWIIFNGSWTLFSPFFLVLFETKQTPMTLFENFNDHFWIIAIYDNIFSDVHGVLRFQANKWSKATTTTKTINSIR